MHMFRAEGEGYVARVDPVERSVLLDVVDDVVALLGGPEGADVVLPRMSEHRLEPPADPAVHRLLPDASADPEHAAELRRLTEGDVRATKTTNLAQFRAAVDAAGPRLVVGPDDAPAVAAALTDLRLVLAERLGVRTDADSEALHDLVLGGDDTDDPRRGAAVLHVALGMLQESLLQLMIAGLDADPD